MTEQPNRQIESEKRHAETNEFIRQSAGIEREMTAETTELLLSTIADDALAVLEARENTIENLTQMPEKMARLAYFIEYYSEIFDAEFQLASLAEREKMMIDAVENSVAE